MHFAADVLRKGSVASAGGSRVREFLDVAVYFASRCLLFYFFGRLRTPQLITMSQLLCSLFSETMLYYNMLLLPLWGS